MTDPAPDAARLAWFEAPDRPARDACVQALVRAAQGGADWRGRSRATTHLIELTHLARHPLERRRLVEALGGLESASAVPALHAELHHPDAGVREAALTAIGELAFHFGGAMVARWLAARDLGAEPPGMADAALLALARTGHAAVEAEAARLWSAGLVSARALHLALADAASPALLDLARQHVSTPDAAVSAALHLASRRVPDLADALRPLRRSPDLAQVHLAERILAAPSPSAEDDLLALVSRRWRLGPLGRAARRLRVHPVEALVEALAVLRDEDEPGTWGRRHFCRGVLLIGAPTLQAAVLDWLEAEGHPEDLAYALPFAGQPTPALRGCLERCLAHGDDGLAVSALRCRVNTLGDLTPDDLSALAAGAVEAEAVRGLMNLYRDQKGPDRKTRLTGKGRRAAEAMLRSALRSGAPGTRRLAAYTVGNMGMTGLQGDLRRLATDEDPSVRQGAAASLHVLPPKVPATELLDWGRQETEPDVRFRLGLCLLEALEAGQPVDGAALAAWCRDGLSDRADLRVLSLRLRGFARDAGAAEALCAAAAGPHLSAAAAALSALGVLAAADTLPALESALSHADPERRRRAVESLASFPAPAAGTLLVRAASEDPDDAVRRAALGVLARRPASPAEMAALTPAGPEDPLLFELLEARAAAAGGRRGAAEVDRALADAVPGLQPDRLARRCPGALQALRTAEFLSSGVALPDGLDAAPPALFWVKGLELWLDVELRGVQGALRSEEARTALDAQRWRWSGLRGRVPGWPAGSAGDGWNRLLGTLLAALERRHASVMSLTCVAGMVVVAGPLAGEFGLPRGLVRGETEGLGALAGELVALAGDRNRLTHRAAGSAAEAEEVRRRAVDVATRIVTSFG